MKKLYNDNIFEIFLSFEKRDHLAGIAPLVKLQISVSTGTRATLIYAHILRMVRKKSLIEIRKLYSVPVAS